MSWRDRVNKQLILTSPEKNTFYAYWASDEVSGEKKNGVFEYPQVEGATVQPLKIGAISYPLSFWFAGDDHDIEAQRFMKALSEDGKWSIVHPVQGELDLYPSTFSFKIDPVSSGNVTSFKVKWILAKPLEFITLSPSAKKQIPLFVPPKSAEELVDTTNQAMVSRLVDEIKQETPGAVAKFADDCLKFSESVSKTLESIYTSIASVNRSIQSIKRSIEGTVDEAIIDITAIGGQFQNLIQLPAQVEMDIQQKLTLYERVLTAAYDLQPIQDLFDTGDSGDAKNSSVLREFISIMVVGAVSISIQIGEVATRSLAVLIADDFNESFSDMTDGLDAYQELFDDDTIDKQYFSQTTSFADSLQLVTTTNNELLKSSLDLAIEKRITLDRPRAPIEIVITEYGDLGEDDSNLDEFIAVNKLKNNDILVLPSGREVLVYV